MSLVSEEAAAMARWLPPPDRHESVRWSPGGFPEIADHHQQNIGKIVADQLPRMGFPAVEEGSPSSLALEADLLLSQTPCITVVPGIIMLLFDFDRLYLLSVVTGKR